MTQPMTDTSVLLSFLLFCVVMTGTPGPNNAMVLLVGARVGVWRAMPLVAGISVGVGLLLAALGLGLGTLLSAIPGFDVALRVVGAAYILWLAWKIASSGPLQVRDDDTAPMGFFGGVAFQWVNPKAWAVTISGVATYVPAEHHAQNVLLAAVILLLVSVPCVGIWAVGGATFHRLLMHPRYALLFNLSMALVLLVATLPALVQSLAL